MSDEQDQWFEVQATIKVKAADDSAAINVVAHALSTEKVRGVFPVGAFNAQPCWDPTRRTT